MKKAKRKTSGKLGIVCAWREGETDLHATVESATASAGSNATIYAVEDKTLAGPGRTRHRGIEAAGDCDVIAIIDAHMRFDGACLAKLADKVRKTGGLVCASVHHNEECAMGKNPYRGGRIVYRAQDGKAKNALAVKWSREHTPGSRGAVVGACYVFPRAWYYAAGQPLAALPGWGCDEEALSISAWMAGMNVECSPHECAHRYRPRPPWPVSDAEHAAVHASRMALIHAVVSEVNARRELELWQRSWVREGIPACASPEAERWRLALLKLPRTWREWRAKVCEPDEIDGVQASRPGDAQAAPRPAPIRNPTTIMRGVECPHCHTIHDPVRLEVSHTYPYSRRHPCPECGNNFISFFRGTV